MHQATGPNQVWSWGITWLATTVRGGEPITLCRRTLKHTPAYPRLPFANLASATRWVTRFVNWYNGTHRHSAIRYVTPDQRHQGCERADLASRHELYERMGQENPERWSRATRNWLPVGSVVLNPEREPARQLS